MEKESGADWGALCEEGRQQPESLDSSQSTPGLFPVPLSGIEHTQVGGHTACRNLDLIALSIREAESLDRVEKTLRRVERVLNSRRRVVAEDDEAVCNRIVGLLQVQHAALTLLWRSQEKWERLKAVATADDVAGLPRQAVRKSKVKALFGLVESLGRMTESLLERSGRMDDAMCSDGLPLRNDAHVVLAQELDVKSTSSDSCVEVNRVGHWTDSSALPVATYGNRDTFSRVRGCATVGGYHVLLISEEEVQSRNSETRSVEPELIDVW